ncbi:hypothetical protein SNE40_021981 [Patella caerulea]|uniref:Farnesoic acid O-methyl transferase domain-containing protein n=1 Tax=Patella caerulea TaxID=87958 RepID=A0AAN8G584_PATCE
MLLLDVISADYLTFVTKENLQNTKIYWDVAGVSSALFSIETCGRVDIVFTTNFNHVFYEVRLGDCSNRCTTIQKVVSNNTESTPTTVYLNPLKCSSYGDVWISWDNTTYRLEVGIGHVLHQDVFVAMDNMDNNAIVERMTIQSSLSAKWKIDVYGCAFGNWQEWNRWANGTTSGRLTNRRRMCHCKRPSSHPTFDGDFHCDGEFEQKINGKYMVLV